MAERGETRQLGASGPNRVAPFPDSSASNRKATAVPGEAERTDEAPPDDPGDGHVPGFLERLVAGDDGGVFKIEEVSALVRYASEHGMDPGAKLVGPIHVALNRLRLARTKEERAAARDVILPLYVKLSALTFAKHGVNGATIVDSGRILRHLLLLIIVGTAFFAIAVLIGFADVRFKPAEALDFGHSARLVAGIYGFTVEEWRFVFAFLSPFAWGGLGATLFLLKQLSDAAQAFTFDRRRLQGVGTRIFLGAVFAAVVTNLFVGPEIMAEGTMKIGPSALAFLTGLGTKVIYSAFERTIDGIHVKLAGPGPQGDVKPTAGAKS